MQSPDANPDSNGEPGGSTDLIEDTTGGNSGLSYGSSPRWYATHGSDRGGLSGREARPAYNNADLWARRRGSLRKPEPNDQPEAD